MNEQKLNEFLKENRPEAPEASSQEKTKIWAAIEGSTHEAPWYFRPAGLRFAGAFAAVIAVVWFFSAPYRQQHQEAANTERYVATLVDAVMTDMETEAFEGDLSEWD